MTHALDIRNPFVAAMVDRGVRASGDGWIGNCPAHDDSTASLSIGVGDDRRMLVHCHAGCTAESVVAALGCKMADLMPPPTKPPKPRIVAEYPYCDEAGKLLYQALRYEPKRFKQRAPKEGGGWEWKLNGARRVLYHLPQLIAATSVQPGLTVFVVEGEKDVARLEAAGLVATCNVGGAGKWRDEYSQFLAGCHVVILADNDKAGRDHAKQVAKSASAAAASVKAIELLGLAEKGDVSDWLDAGHAIEELLTIVAATPNWTPPAKSTEADAIVAAMGPVISNATGDDDELYPQSMGEVLDGIKQITDGWPRRVGSSLFVDDPGHGVCRLERENNLFGYLASRARVEWHRSMGCVSRGEVFAELQRTAQSYQAIESFPHFPPRPAHYYSHPQVELGNGDHLRELLSRFCPETEIDRDLILAMIASTFWGGDGGARPAFAIASKHGRGVGKTTVASTAGRLSGGMFAISKDDRAQDIDKRLLTPDAATKRIVCLDNVKANALSWPELEARITAREISGHQMYSGERTRPNTLLWCITLNGPSLSKDMAQRCVVIRLGQPTHSGDWEDSLRTFVDEHRWQIIGDLATFFAEAAPPLAKHTRWGSWEREVLARLPEPEEAQRVIGERQGEVDATDEEAADIEDFFRQKLQWLGYNPETQAVHIPNGIARDWYMRATGLTLSTTAVTRSVKQGADEGTLKNLSVNTGRKYGRGLLWGKGSAYYELEERLRAKQREQHEDT
jgi:hypothetical protein